MKKNLMLLVMCFVLVSFSSYAQLKVNSSGRVGIGTDPDSGYNLRLSSAIFVSGSGYPDIIISYMPDGYGRAIYPSSNGQCKVGTSTNQFLSIHGMYIYQNGSLVSSDQRLKENFRTIEKPLEKLMQMNGLKYDFIEDKQDTLSSEKAKFAKLEKDRMGFVAQDLEKIFPEAVFYDEEIDRYYIEYNAVIPVIVEAMKEQQAQIEGLKAELAGCCGETLKSGSINSTGELKLNVAKAKLYQNNPNPFSVQTTVKFEIPETVQKAQLLLCDMNGSLLKTIGVNQRGAGNILISANELTAGIYLYTLIADGREIATKRMILTE